MTRNEFMILCERYFVDPLTALENENICDALRQRDVEQVKDVLESEF